MESWNIYEYLSFTWIYLPLNHLNLQVNTYHTWSIWAKKQRCLFLQIFLVKRIIVEICGLFQWTLISKHETSLLASYWDHGALGMVHGISQVTSDTTPECQLKVTTKLYKNKRIPMATTKLSSSWAVKYSNENSFRAP